MICDKKNKYYSLKNKNIFLFLNLALYVFFLFKSAFKIDKII
jgi:hypothetical protein